MTPVPRQLAALRQAIETLLDVAEKCAESENMPNVLDAAEALLIEHRRVLMVYHASKTEPAPAWEGTGKPERLVEPVDE